MLLIQSNVSLKPYNTFHVDVEAERFVEINQEKDLRELMATDAWNAYPHLILGDGANMLFTKNYSGLVMRMNIMGRKVISEDDTHVVIGVFAGEDWNETLQRFLSQGYVGGENMVGIPGQVGSAAVGNIGAYGKEAKDIISAVEGIDLLTKEKIIYRNTECSFGYRDSIFKHELKDRFLLTAVVFQLQKETPEYQPSTEYKDIQEVMKSQGKESLNAKELADIILSIRQQKLPDWKQVGTAGSFFKNPTVSTQKFEELSAQYPNLTNRPQAEGVKLSAGQLIELAGLKGFTLGQVGVSANHGLILLNYGNGSGAEIVHLAEHIQAKVKELFDIYLEPEVKYV